MQLKKTLLAAGLLALLTGTAQSSGWSPGDMPWSGKGKAPWSRDNMPWGERHRNWSWNGRDMPWEGRRGTWRGDKGWDDWAPWRKGRKMPWSSGEWGKMPWSNSGNRRWRGYPPAGYGRPPAHTPPRRPMMMPPGANKGNIPRRGPRPQMGPTVPRPVGPPPGRSMPR